MNGACDQCQNAFEDANVYIELIIETTHMQHKLEFCGLACCNMWTGYQMGDD